MKQIMKVTYITIIASALLFASFATINPTLASDDDKNLLKVDVTVLSTRVTITDDVVDGYRMRHRELTATLTGEGLNGVGKNQQVLMSDVSRCEGCSSWSQSINYCTGCVDGHTGTLFWISSVESVYLDEGGSQFSWLGTWEVVEGTGDLEGARGGGKIYGELVADVLTSKMTGKIHFEGKGP
jgi:hypothetical protein